MLSLLYWFLILSLILVFNEQKKWLFQHIFVLHDFKCGLYLTRMIITWRWWWSQCKVFSHAMKPVVSIGLRFYDTPERPAPKGWTINLILIFIIIINRVLDVRSYGESSVLRGFCLGRAGRVLWRALLDSWLGGMGIVFTLLQSYHINNAFNQSGWDVWLPEHRKKGKLKDSNGSSWRHTF